MNEDISIAYLILCHVDPKHIKRLTDRITQLGDEAFVHVDAKCDIGPFEQELKGNINVHILEQRVCVHWGGYSSIEATINLFRTALSSKKQFNRFVILQGLEYPIKSNSEIHTFFETNREKEFILAQNISKSENFSDIHKYYLYWDLDARNVLSKVFLKINNKFFLKNKCILKFKKNYTRNTSGDKMYIYQGCAQFGVTRALAEYIIEFHDQNKEFNRYFQTIFAPDEAYFHTIVYNSAYVKQTPYGKAIAKPRLEDFKNLSYFEYPQEVTLFKDKSDWPKLRDSGFLFFRKASSESRELLDYIDKKTE